MAKSHECSERLSSIAVGLSPHLLDELIPSAAFRRRLGTTKRMKSLTINIDVAGS